MPAEPLSREERALWAETIAPDAGWPLYDYAQALLRAERAEAAAKKEHTAAVHWQQAAAENAGNHLACEELLKAAEARAERAEAVLRGALNALGEATDPELYEADVAWSMVAEVRDALSAYFEEAS